MRTLVRTVLAVAALALAAFAFAARAQDAPDPVGEWTGILETPQNDLALVLHISRNADGVLEGAVENATQAPGQKVPMSEITVADGHLSWRIARIAASYDGDWSKAEQQWQGTFDQGLEMPLAFSRGLPPALPMVEGLDGRWEGTAELNGVTLRQVLRIATDERGTSILYDSPDQMANGLVAEGFARDGRAIAFTTVRGACRFEGQLNQAATELTGRFTNTVTGDVAEVALARLAADAERAPPARPQTPEEPFPYAVEEVNFENPQWPDVHLAGTLTLPEGAGPFPAAILITGSGGQDRDESIMGHKPFAVIADHLSRNGIAVLRYDDRGIGKSTGDYGSATSADLATDANAAAAYLMSRAEIDRNAIGFVGHSEGGMIGPLAAVDNPAIAYLVLLAAPGSNLDRLILSQQRLLALSMGARPEQIDRQEPVIAAMLAAIAGAADAEHGIEAAGAVLTSAALAELGVPPDFDKDLIVGRFASPWFRYFLTYEPAAVLQALEIPILALGGTLDLQVPSDENLPAIEAATKGNPDVTIVELEGLNHLFQHAETGGMGEYAQIEETFAPEALDAMSDWIAARFLTD